jgi:voltage-gated potassium channel
MKPASIAPQGQSALRLMFTDPTCPSFLRWQSFVNLWIFISCVSMSLESVDAFAAEHRDLLNGFEWTAVAFFTLDYLGNLFFAKDRVRYFFSFWGLVDLVSIVPSYLMLMNLSSLRGAKVFRILRVVRVLRVLKMAKFAMQQLTMAQRKKNPIVSNLKIYLIALFSVMMISSTLMYHVEGESYTKEALAAGQAALDEKIAADPASKNLTEDEKKFVPVDPISGTPIPADKQFFTSIPTAMWWCIVTLTTTGYGDMYPVTTGGRVIAGTTMLLGLVLFGILMNIVGKTLMVLLFGEQISEEDASKESVLKTMLELHLINGAQYDELCALSEEEFRDRLKRVK